MAQVPHLVSFVRTAEHGSFSAAARILGLTPAGLLVPSAGARVRAGDDVRNPVPSRLPSRTGIAEALEKGWIVAAGLDVFEREPLARTSHLVGRDNVVMSPHIGATTSEAFHAASLDAAKKVAEFASSGTVSDPLPPDEPWMAGGFAKLED